MYLFLGTLGDTANNREKCVALPVYLLLGTLGILLVTEECAKHYQCTGFGVLWTPAENSAIAPKQDIALLEESLHAKSND